VKLLSPSLTPRRPTFSVHDIGGIRLRVCVEGAGPPLLLINGIGANIEVWGPFKGLLSARRVISFDAPGAGASPVPDRPLRMHHLADLVAGLLDQLHCERADVLGYSFGGALAQQLAHQHPARVRRLILAATIPGVGAVQNPYILMKMSDPRLLTMPADRRQETVSRVVGGRSGRDPEVLAVYERARLVTPSTPEGYRLQLRALLGWSSIPWLHTLRMPTLILAGDDDRLVPVINSSIFARLIPDCRRYVVPGGGHLFPVDQPQDIVGVIDAFLDEPALLPPGAQAGPRAPAPRRFKRRRTRRRRLTVRRRRGADG
jgi:poly(3-hydroxyalkanoate) depolymerase